MLFPFYFMYHYRRLNKQPEPHEPVGANNRAVFERFITQQHKLAKYMCIKEMLQTWFWKVPLEQIKKGNVADLICYGFFYKPPTEMPPGMADELVAELEDAWGISLEPGYNEGLEFMSHLWQDLRVHYRPLSFYLGIEFLFALKHVVMLSVGFRTHSLQGYTYYTRGVPTKAVATEGSEDHGEDAPILFMHGVGIGLLPYIGFVMRLATLGRPLVVLECSHLGMRLQPKVPSVDEVVEVLVDILNAHCIDRVSVSAHSYGTLKASRFVQMHPERVHSLSLIDPVCFVMFSGKLVHNFVYRPRDGSALTTWIVARDIHHATAVCRNFFWSLLCLWADQLPDRTLVVLSGKDELVPVQESLIMLEHESNAEVLYHEDHTHAAFLKDFPWQDRIVDGIRRMLDDEHTQPPTSPRGTWVEPVSRDMAQQSTEGLQCRHLRGGVPPRSPAPMCLHLRDAAPPSPLHAQAAMTDGAGRASSPRLGYGEQDGGPEKGTGRRDQQKGGAKVALATPVSPRALTASKGGRTSGRSARSAAFEEPAVGAVASVQAAGGTAAKSRRASAAGGARSGSPDVGIRRVTRSAAARQQGAY